MSGVKTINIDDIVGNVYTWNKSWKTYKIEDTPHYKYLLGDKQPYIIYTEETYPSPHNTKVYDQLIDNFNYKKRWRK